ncbi:alkaline phosphatase D family protein [Chloroflexota bacterium]
MKVKKHYFLLSVLIVIVLTALILLSACCGPYIYQPEWTYDYDIETTNHQSYGIFGGDDWISMDSTIRKIVNEDYEEALEWANNYIDGGNPAYDPDAILGHYVKVLTLSAQNELDNAWTALGASLTAGLPMELFMAGPKSLMQNLYEDSRFAAKVTEDNIMLVHGPMIGNVTDSSASFWARTWVELPVQVYVYEKADLTGQVIKSDKKTTVPDDDMTAVVTVTGLEADTMYYYQVKLHDVAINIDPVPSFKTSPESGEGAVFSVGFGGGCANRPTTEYMWETIANQNFQAFMLLGDNVYHDDSSSLEKQRHYFYMRQSNEYFRDMVASTPLYSIYDDHDYGVNDAVTYSSHYADSDPVVYVTGTDGKLEPIWRPKVLDVFTENFLNPYYGQEDNPGCYFDYSIGDVDFFMLDGRYYRENPMEFNPATMLGEDQLQWLKDKLSASTATFKVICSPVPFTPGIKAGSVDPWDGFDAEREKIFDHIADNEIEGVVLIAADRHRTDCRKILRDTGYDFYEFESSVLTNTQIISIAPAQPGTELLWGYNEMQSMGMLSFNTTIPDPTVTFWCVNIEGNVPEGMFTTVPLSELSFT